LAACAAALPLLAAPAAAAPPPEGRCPSVAARPAEPGTDAAPVLLREGEILSYESLLSLRTLLPDEIFQHRHVFFYPGMAMSIGACHRRYPEPAFFTRATERFAGGVSLGESGELRGYVAGVPFPPESIDPAAADAALRWAWNLELRFRGAGPVGSFRIHDIPTRIGKVLVYEGSFFFYPTRHRSDLAVTDYTVPEGDSNLWVAGGRFDEPTSARHLAWRQMRPEKVIENHSVSDQIFVYVPTMRKVRRAGTTWVDGMYVPRYRVAGDSGGGGVAVGGNAWSGPQGAINPTAGESIQQTEYLPRGFLSLAIRPNAYVWRLLGEREVLAPINVGWPGYPIDPNRNYGPHGLSVASDRWDVRWAVVIEGLARVRNLDVERVIVYVDWQTRQPLYVFTRGAMGRLLEVGIPVHRFSDDTLNYPGWEDGEKASVFDPVAEAFYRVVDDSGWLRESFDVRSIPVDEEVRRRFTSTDFLVRGH
jgi:hypothetical protein